MRKNSTFQAGFTLPEVLGVLAILLVILSLSLFNFREAQTKARDEQRKANARQVVSALENYHKDVRTFPPSSSEGKIIACGEVKTPSPCQWGADKIVNPLDPGTVYLDPLPLDPRQGQGSSLFYVSIGSNFQIFAHLERKQDAENSPEIAKWNLVCGREICNYGITLSRAPVKKLLEATESGELKQ